MLRAQQDQGRSEALTRGLGWVALLAIVLLIVLISYGIGGIVVRDLAAQRELRSGLSALDAVLRLQLDEETGVRGFAATGDHLLLQPFDQGRAALPAAFDALDAALARIAASGLTINQADVSVRMLRDENATWMSAVGVPLTAGAARGNDAALQRRGKTMVDRFRRDVAALGTELDATARRADEGAQQAIAIVATIGVVLALVLGGAIVTIVRRALELEVERERTATVVRRERDLRTLAEAIPQLVWVLADDATTVTFVNGAWARYTGLDAEATTNGKWLDAVHPDDRAPVAETWATASEARQRYEIEYRLRDTEGEYRWFLARAVPLYNDRGTLVSWFGTSTDIDAQKTTQQRLGDMLDREMRASMAFQEAALPQSLPRVAGITFDAVYRAGGTESHVGGDWFDAFRLVDGRLVFTVGDVLGSGLDAAVTMNGIRQALRGAAHIFPDPVAILDAADRALRFDRPESIVTAFVAILDPVTMTLVYAGAGHPPPFVREADGSVTAIDGTGLPLGLRALGVDPEAVRTRELREPTLLVFYTDGLIEVERDLLAGEAAVIAALRDERVAGAPQPARELVSRVIGIPPLDDVAVLAVRIESASQAVRRLEGSAQGRWDIVASDASAARSSREQMAAILREHGLSSDDITTAELVFSELIGNVLRHGGDRAEIRIDVSARNPVIHVLDRGNGFTYSPMLPLDPLSENGRGLYIISRLTDNFTVVPRESGGSHARAVLTVTEAARARPVPT